MDAKDTVNVSETNNFGIGIITLSVGAFIFFVIFCGKLFETKEEEKDEVNRVEKKDKSEATIKVKKQLKTVKKSSGHTSFTHRLLHASLKGHSGNILGTHFSINGKYLATASDDRTVRLWSVKDFGTGNKCVRVNVDLDHAKCIQFSPDSRAFVVGLARCNTVRVFRLGKKDDGTTTCTPLEVDFPEAYKEELLNIGVGATSSGGSFVMTAYKDTTIMIRDLKGEVLNTINTNLGNNNYACVSPCGRFVAACGWTPDVKVWEVKFTRTGEYKDVQKVFELKGHTSSVWSFAFNNDSTRMLSASKDGCWRLFDTDIEYDKGQEPCLLNQGIFDLIGISNNICLTALSFDGNVAAVAVLNNFCIFSTRSGEVHSEFKEVHSQIISSLSFDISGRYLVSSGDRHVHVFHNVLGYREKIQELEEKIKKVTSSSAMRERLEQQKAIQELALEKVLQGKEKSRGDSVSS